MVSWFRMAERRSSLPLIVAAAAFAALLIVFATRFPLIEYLVRRMALPLVFGAATALAAVGVGAHARMLLGRILRRETDAGRVTSDLLIGLPLFGTAAFLLGTIAVERWSSLALLVAGIILGARALRRYGRTDTAIAAGPAVFVGAGLIAAVFAIGALNAQAPPFTLDEVAYHLAIPKTWTLEGRAIELPLISHSYFPLGVESASLPAFALLGDAAGYSAHWLHFFAAFACAVLLYALLRERTTAEIAIAVTAAAVTIPPLAVTTGWAWLEWPLVGIALVAFSALERIAEGDDDAFPTFAAALAAGLLTKYTFGAFAIAAIGAAWFAMPRAHRRLLVAPLLAGGIAGSVFMIRNLILTANPLAPFFGALAPEVSGFRAVDENPIAMYLFDPRFIDEALAIAAPLFVIVAILGIRTQPRFTRAIAVAMLVLLAALFALRPSARILLPALIVLAIPAAASLHAWLADASRASSALARGALLLAAAVQLILCGVYAASYRPMELVTANESEEQFLDRARNTAPAIRAANALLPTGSRALVVGIHETYWFSTPVRGGGNFDGGRVSQYLEAPDPASLFARLSADRITHLVIAGQGIVTPDMPDAGTRAERVTRLSPIAYQALDGVIAQHATLVGSAGSVTVFALKQAAK
ncbi:MAG: hypothetical protein ACYC7A_18855 [Thermoanaerobaculia bacterium]